MKCREFVDFLMDYLDDTLDGSQRRTFDTHMDECPSCLTYLDTYRETVRLGRSLCDDLDADVPEEVPERVIQAILAARDSTE